MTIATEIAALVLVFALAGFATSRAEAQQTPSTQEDARRQAPISVADAERIALAQFPGGEVRAIERDHEHGRAVFDVEVRDRDGREHEVVIDVESGRILRSARDD